MPFASVAMLWRSSTKNPMNARACDRVFFMEQIAMAHGPLPRVERRVAFRAAILLSGYGSIERWGQIIGVNSSSIYLVMRGVPNPRIEKMIDDLCYEWIGASALKHLHARIAREAEALQSEAFEHEDSGEEDAL